MPLNEEKVRTDSNENITGSPDSDENIAEQTKNSESKKKKQRSPMTPIQIFLLNLLIVITVMWLLFGFVIGAVTAPNDDMSPNIKSKDLLLYYRLDNSYSAQDTVVFVKKQHNLCRKSGCRSRRQRGYLG